MGNVRRALHDQRMTVWEMAEHLAQQQHGVISRRQCLDLGMLDTQVTRAGRERGPWQRVLPGIYAVTTGQLTQTSLVAAAVLFGGPTSQVSGLTALAWYGCTYLPRATGLDLLIDWRLRRQPAGYVRFHRTRALPPAFVRADVPLSPVDRAALLAARHLVALSDVRAVLSEVVQRRLTTVGRLAHALAREPVAGSALSRRVLGELGAGCLSVPEMELRDLVLTRPALASGVVWNHPLDVRGRRLVADACWPAVRVVVEVDSIAHHGLGDGPEHTSRRRAALVAAGWRVLSVSPRRIREEPLRVLAEIEALVLA